MTSMKLFAAAALATLLACGPGDPVPQSPNNPADPNAPRGEPAPGSGTLSSDGMGTPMNGDGNGDNDGDGDHGDHDDHGGTVSAEDKLIATEMEALAKAKPVFARYCVGCHTTDGAGSKKAKTEALKHLTMDSYPYGGHHAGEVAATIKTSIGATSKAATMPKDDPGAVTGAERAAVVAWAAAFDAAHAAKAGHHKHHGHDTHEKSDAPKPDGHKHKH